MSFSKFLHKISILKKSSVTREKKKSSQLLFLQYASISKKMIVLTRRCMTVSREPSDGPNMSLCRDNLSRIKFST